MSASNEPPPSDAAGQRANFWVGMVVLAALVAAVILVLLYLLS